MARDFEKASRFGARSLPEIAEALYLAHARVAAGRRVTFRGATKRLPLEAYLNAIVLDWLRKPQDEQDAHLAMRLRELEELMQRDEPGDLGLGGGHGAAPAPPVAPKLSVAESSPKAKRPARRRPAG